MENGKIKNTEIMNGDWVLFNGKPVQIAAVSEFNDMVAYFDNDIGQILDADINVIQPIPITHDILNKNGFVCKDIWHGIVEHKHTEHIKDNIDYKGLKFSTNNELVIEMCKDTDEVRNIKLKAFNKSGAFEMSIVKPCDTHYVHELQHALKTCGFDKKIEL